LAGLATIALFAVVVLFSVYVFWQAETVSPGFPTELVISLLLIVAWLVAALASVKTSYDLLYNQRDYLLLRTAPIPTRTVLSVRL
jgi:hypothetical protein